MGNKAEIHKCGTVEERSSNYAIWKLHSFNIYFNKFPSMTYCSHATYCNKHKNLLHKEGISDLPSWRRTRSTFLNANRVHDNIKIDLNEITFVLSPCQMNVWFLLLWELICVPAIVITKNCCLWQLKVRNALDKFNIFITIVPCQ